MLKTQELQKRQSQEDVHDRNTCTVGGLCSAPEEEQSARPVWTYSTFVLSLSQSAGSGVQTSGRVGSVDWHIK